jgi:hypothetical protein
MPDWSTGILGCANCSDCGFCCLSTWCGCIAYGMNTALMEGHRGYSQCCFDQCSCPQSCECQYCGNACCLFAAFSANCSSFQGHPRDMTELILGISCELLTSMLRSIITGVLIYNQLTAIGKERGFYKEHIPSVCGCCDEACCLSIWCGPCMLTRVHREILNGISTDDTGHKAKTYEYKLGTFTVQNSMFENVKITETAKRAL